MTKEQNTTDPIDDKKEYRRAFRKQVFRILKLGYDRLNAMAYRAAEEEDITGDLVNEINEITQDRSYPRWVSNLYVVEDPRVNVDDRKGKRRKKIDIEFVRVQYGPRPRFYFEAKRLSSGSNPIGKYLGSEGLGEFLSGNYGREAEEAGMLGYIQSNTAEYWAKEAKSKLLSETNHYQLYQNDVWVKSIVINEFDHCYLTRHSRQIGKSPINIFHCFLLFV